MKSVNPLPIGLIVCALWFGPDRLPGAEPRPQKNADDLFSPPRVIELKIEIPPASLEALQQAPKDYVKSSVREGDRVFSNVGIRYKGTNQMTSPSRKPSFTIKFNEFVAGQRFHGTSRVLLDASTHDPTYLSGLLANELFRAAGVPAARAAFARLEVNGKDLGLYVLSEAVNRDFLGRHFERTKGNLYEGDGHDVTDTLDKDSGDEHKDQPDVEALAKAAQEPDPAQRWKKLAPVLDVDRFISFLAVEVLVWQDDGYAMKTNKYRLYHDPASDRMVFVPHGADAAFSRADGALFPKMSGLVARAILETPEGRQQYRERMTKILSGHFKVPALHARIDELAAKVKPVLAKCDPDAAKNYDAAVAQLRETIAKRAYFLEQELRKAGK